MAITLFSGSNLTVISDGPEVDLKSGEFHRFSATATNFTIESGANSADHIIENPDTLEVYWTMSNLDSDGQSYGNRAATFLDSIHTLIKERGLHEVVTRHRTYPSMAIVDVSAEHTGPFTGAIRGRIAFQAVPLALLERTIVPEAKIATSAKKTASTQTNSGRVEASTPTEADKKSAERGSLLSQVFKR